MSRSITLLHSMRGQQLRALSTLTYEHLSKDDFIRIADWYLLCGDQFDTRNLSDKSLEEIDAMSAKYLDRVR